ncbi:MAG: isoprenyl transferase [Candidatus Marinimicrobia bacterium]|nr:isoprenyl transferase [Candidatus Neomarinimicrobiota bacterium]MDD5581589.1 isoprenyl transferase [Candidatus Neomarinimicrobiota bacterium]
MASTFNIETMKKHPRVPKHVAVIMDGNGRWAKERGLPRISGHIEGINSVRDVVKAAHEVGVKYLTLYTFSKENWNRPASEVSALMSLLVKTLHEEISELNRNNVRFNVIGCINDLPDETAKQMLEGIELTKNNTGLTLTLALSYGSRFEISEAVRSLCWDVFKGTLLPQDVNETLISSRLYTADMPDPDLLIRTGGEMRFSNFLLWQSAYAEFYVTQTYWPDFRKNDFFEAIQSYLSRERRFGKVSEQLNK